MNGGDAFLLSVCSSACYTMSDDETANGNDEKVEVTAVAGMVRLQGQFNCSDKEWGGIGQMSIDDCLPCLVNTYVCSCVMMTERAMR